LPKNCFPSSQYRWFFFIALKKKVDFAPSEYSKGYCRRQLSLKPSSVWAEATICHKAAFILPIDIRVYSEARWVVYDPQQKQESKMNIGNIKTKSIGGLQAICCFIGRLYY